MARNFRLPAATTAIAATAMTVATLPALAAAAEVNIYTTREPGLIQPLLDAWQAETGNTVNTIHMKDGLAERVAAEGESSPADLMMMVDAGRLEDLAERGLTQAIDSEVIDASVPAEMRDPEDQWTGLSMRARVLYAAKDLDLDSFTYEQLDDPEWKGRICIRSGQHPYNTALFADYIVHHGEAATEEWLSGLRDNLARKAGGGDRDVAKDIMGGICDIGIANSYYVGLMRSGAGGDEQKPWGEAIKVILPTFEDGGTQVNISGAALAKHAPNREAAVALLEWLVSDEAQKIYAEANYEYPVNPDATVDPLIAEFGELKIDPVPLTEIVAQRDAASRLAEKVGFDD